MDAPGDYAAILDEYARHLDLERGRSEHTRRAYLTDLRSLFGFLDERAPGAGLKPSDALAAVIGAEPVARTEVIKKVWDYVKAHGLQDATNKRAINADAALRPVFGKDQITMFELAGIVGKHLSAP